MSEYEEEPGFSEPEMTPSQARNSWRIHSAVFARRVWAGWLVSKDKEMSAQQGVVVEALKDTLRLGGIVARGMGIRPQEACLASLEVQTGQDWSYMQSMREITDTFIAHNSQLPEDTNRLVLDADDPRARISAIEYRASELIFNGTRRLHDMLDGGEQDRFALGDYLNAIVYAARLFGQQVDDGLELTGPED